MQSNEIKNSKPEWTPQNAGEEFTSSVMPGKINSENPSSKPVIKAKNLSIQDYKNGVLAGDKTILARAITLIESNSTKHLDIAQELIKEILPYTGKSIRIGITGVPGAGKSTFIETFGLYLIDNNYRPAVLAIDPSSTVSKGSILGDKTRMEQLSRNDQAFIRPSPSAGNLGGVTRKTRETMLLCEAAGYDVILIETVGVGQNEVTVRSMVDFFLLILISGAGDELQGIKKGVIELADAILVNKADGDNIIHAETAKAQYNNALHYLSNATPGWTTKAYTCSAVENKGIDNIWSVINDFVEYTKSKEIFTDRRIHQTRQWFESMLNNEILNSFYRNPYIKEKLFQITEDIKFNEITAVSAVKKMIDLYKSEVLHK